MKLLSAILVAALVVSASAAQSPASVSWSLTSDLAVTATSGAAAGSGTQQSNLTFRDFTGSLGDGTAGLARWYTGDNWPDEDAPDPDRYVQFAAAGTGGAALTVTAIALTVNGGGTGNLRATLAYDTDPSFATATVLEDVAASRDVIGPFNYPVDVTVPDGDSLYVRVYPYLPGGSTSSGKYLFLRDVSVSGTAASAATPATATWLLDGATTTTATTAGAIVALDETVTSEYVIRDYAGSEGSQRVYAPGGPGNGLGYWPAETEVNLARYAQFVVKPQEGTTLTATGLALRLGNSGGSNDLRASVRVSADGFATETVLDEAAMLPSSALTDVAYPLSEAVADGDSLTVRVYPWLIGGRDSGKYFNIAGVVVTGETTGTPIVTLATVSTDAVTSISTTSAVSGGTVASDGGGAVTARGVAYGTAPNPTVADGATVDGDGVGAFVSTLGGLAPDVTYYVRAYATNSAGTAYGDEQTFTTLGALSVPTVTSAEASNVLVTTAVLGGAVTFDGGLPVTARGVCVSATGTPTTADLCAEAGEGLGSFSAEIAGLTQETAYTARAYATNDQGTAYGAEVTFTTEAPAPSIEIVVAQDGSGDYTTVQAAFDAVPSLYTGPVTVRVKAGTYAEKVILEAGKINVHLIGDGAESTVITWDDYSGKVVDGVTLGTYTSYTAAIDADDFIAEDITFQNTYNGSQAVALRVRGDRMAFYDVRMLGFQDTYYTHSYGRIYHQNCTIEGTVDFIFGRSIAVFDDCEIRSKRDDAPITAANTEPGFAYGYVFRNATLTADAGVDGGTLGRPWGPYAQTVFVDSEIGAHIRPAGWLEWAGTQNHLTAMYAEGGNTGPGADTSARVPWTSVLTPAEVDALTLEAIFARTSAATPYAADWLPEVRASTPSEAGPSAPLASALHTVFPNPTRGTATLHYDLAESGPASVRVYDAVGRHVLTLADGLLAAGAHEASLDASPLPAGVYLVRLTTATAAHTQSLVVVR